MLWQVEDINDLFGLNIDEKIIYLYFDAIASPSSLLSKESNHLITTIIQYFISCQIMYFIVFR